MRFSIDQHDAVDFPERHGWIVDVGGLGGNTIELQNLEAAFPEICNGWAPNVEAAEKESLGTLGSPINGAAQCGRFELDRIQKDCTAAMRTNVSERNGFAIARHTSACTAKTR